VEKGKELLIVSLLFVLTSPSYCWLTKARTCGMSIVMSSSSNSWYKKLSALTLPLLSVVFIVRLYVSLLTRSALVLGD
jgi:hypothetical protein